MTETDITAATAAYIARRDRLQDPEGSFDRKGRWYPSDSESRKCCDSVRPPSPRPAGLRRAKEKAS